jgi:two-component system alkaline phosphatase synthesis response regulator PhoP
MNKKILLVDDHEISIQTQLQLWRYYFGIQADYAKSGEEAVTRASKEDYDLIISDVEMRGVSGANMVAALRKINIDTPIIMLSAHRQSQVVTTCLKAGANDYLLKPINNEVYFQKACKQLGIEVPDEFKKSKSNDNGKKD